MKGRGSKAPSTVVLWRGPSRLDGSPIQVVSSCSGRSPSRNGKTGDVLQVSIMRRDVNPFTAWIQGLDGAVCPERCSHRSKSRGGDATCYVNKLKTKPAWLAASKREVTEESLTSFGSGALIRIGAEGDPSAVPLSVWCSLVSQSAGWYGYTADWRVLGPDWQRLFMASCVTPAEATQAMALGWRVFCSSAAPTDDALYREQRLRECPAVSRGLDCVACAQCDGTKKGPHRPSIYIPLHGAVGASKRRKADRLAAVTT